MFFFMFFFILRMQLKWFTKNGKILHFIERITKATSLANIFCLSQAQGF